MNRNIKHILLPLAALLLAALTLNGCMPTGFTPSPLPGYEPYSTEVYSPVTEQPGSTEVPGATDAPYATEVPFATDAPYVTEAPAEAPFCMRIPLDTECRLDMDADGVPETIYIDTLEADEYYGYYYTITIESGATGAVVLDRTIDYESYDAYAMAIDNATGDGRRALLFCHWFDSEDASTYVIRPQNGGYSFDLTWGYFYEPSPAEDCFLNGHLLFCIRTDVLGTHDVYTETVLTDSGFESIDGIYYYPVYEYYGGTDYNYVSVIADLPVTIIDEATGEGYGRTLSPGASVRPVCTDNATFAYVQLSTGEYAEIFFDDFTYIPYINGRPQDYYLDVLYCD